MVLSEGIKSREYEKFVLDSTGGVAVRGMIVEEGSGVLPEGIKAREDRKFRDVDGSTAIAIVLSNLPESYTSITTANFINAINNSTLVPEQWYKIIDYATFAPVLGVIGTYYTGATEQIYLKAKSVNEVYIDGYSADFEETIKFKQTVAPDTTSVNFNMYGDYFYVDYQQGTNVGSTNITVVSSESFTIDLDSNAITALSSDAYLLAISGEDGNGVAFSLTGDNYGDDWTIDVDGKTIIILDGTSEYLSDGLDFTTIASEEAGYISGQVAAFKPTKDPSGTWDLDIADANNLTINTLETQFATRYAGTFNLSVYDGVNDISVELTDDNENDDWEYDSVNHTIKIIDGSNSYVNSGFDWNNVCWTGNSICASFNYVTQSFNGRIVSRYNPKIEFEYDMDYRGRKVRLCKPVISAWSAGTYTLGQYVVYNNTVYFCMRQTTSTPTTAAYWVSVMPYTYNIFNGGGYVINSSYGLLPDTADYTDVDLFDLTVFNALTTKLNTKIKQSGTDDTCVGYLPSIANMLNVEILLTGYSYINATNNTVMTLAGSNYIGGCQYANVVFNNVIENTCSYSTVQLASNSLIRGLADCQLGRLTYCVLAPMTRTKAVALYDWILADASSDNEIGYMSAVKSWGAITYSTIVNMTICDCAGTITDTQFAKSVIYTNFNGNVLRCNFLGKVYGTSTSNRQTLGYTADCTFTAIVALNYIGTATNITNCKFLGSFANNFTSANPSNASSKFDSSTFCGAVTNITGTGIFYISYSFFAGALGYLTFNNTTYIARIDTNAFLQDFGGAGVGVTFNNTTADFNFRYNTVCGVIYSMTCTRGSVEYNNFLGRIQTVTFGGTTTQAFTYNTVGNYFNTNTIDANVTRCTLPQYWNGRAVTVAMTDLIILTDTENGSLGIDAGNANAILDLTSTTKAFMPPRMTNTQMNAISSPTAGMQVYDSTNNKMCVYDGSVWQNCW